MPLTHRLVPFALLVAAAAPARADKLDKDAKKWLDDVAPIILVDEVKQFEGLKKADRGEFQKIFWARRDPDLGTPENEFKQAYEQASAEADKRFKILGRRGLSTDCGRVFVLLGEPSEVEPQPGGIEPGRRAAEVWVFLDRPGLTFTGGRAEIAFDGECKVPQGARLNDQLKALAESKIVNPGLNYRLDGGRLVKLEDLLPKPSPAQTLLKEPRQDFALAAEKTMVLKSPTDGASYVAGLLKGDGAGLAAQEVGGQKLLRLTLAAQAAGEGGRVAHATEREVLVELTPDGSFVASFGMALRGGSYSLTVAALEASGAKGSAVSVPLEAPDFASTELMMSTLMVLADIREDTTGNKPQTTDPLADFALGPLRLVPRFGNVFHPEDAVTVLCAIYGAELDPETGNPKAKVDFAISHGAKKVAQAPEQTFEQPNPTYSVGPVPLQGYEPGSYVARIDVTDLVANKEYSQETTFEVVERAATQQAEEKPSAP